MLRNSLPFKKRNAKRTLKKLAKSSLNNKLSKNPSRNVTSPWSKSAMDKAQIFVKPSTNQLVPPNTSRNNPVRFNEIYLILLTYTYFCFRFSRIPQLRLSSAQQFHNFFCIGYALLYLYYVTISLLTYNITNLEKFVKTHESV